MVRITASFDWNLVALVPQPEPANKFERAYKREKEARRRAEFLLEGRSRELYQANKKIQEQLQSLQTSHNELKLAQSQLVQSEKMASIGQLAAGIAHEINNPVAFIRSNLNSLNTYLTPIRTLIGEYDSLDSALSSKDESAIASKVDEIAALREEEDFEFLLDDCTDIVTESVDGTDRVTEIVRGLKNFSRLDESDIQEANINDGLESTLNIARNELKYCCEVTTNFAELPPVRCLAGQLNQVFLNLVVNAAQALENTDDGRITISTAATPTDVIIKIQDNGCGIPEENLNTIFNPFFTTKDVGTGTGLGLSISYAIIEKHDGSIDVESTVGVGTTFTITMPIRASAQVAA